ncbi:spondin domain-containing protein [Ferruginibacter lapsinanis]|uniref:spondin domain-containing protein n=1 Tax=Ferruginibacter lapsinanis TaxID=563172 RepID=UPI001E390051|nr:spondin domain-containing protein [Ferruginibacter lapsinanis]UEG50491.1 spondin domain-containing protein [Ferruginibacter lapsinanis]
MRFFGVLFVLIVQISCKKEQIVVSNYSEASYKVTVTLKWQLPEFSVPANAHVTLIAGMVHSADTSMWKPGTKATPGLEAVAEIGAVNTIFTEFDDIVSKQKALYKFVMFEPPGATGSIQTALIANSEYSYVSLASMVAPSPDWFMGIHDVDLHRNNSWVVDTTINMFVYDAGTEDGDIFGYTNPATMPQQNIQLLSPSMATVLANGNITLAPLATIKFTKN